MNVLNCVLQTPVESRLIDPAGELTLAGGGTSAEPWPGLVGPELTRVSIIPAEIPRFPEETSGIRGLPHLHHAAVGTVCEHMGTGSKNPALLTPGAFLTPFIYPRWALIAANTCLLSASCRTSAETGGRERKEGKGAAGAGEGAEREGQGAGAGEGAPRPGEGEGAGEGAGQGAGEGAGPRAGEDQGEGAGAQPGHQRGPEQVKVSGPLESGGRHLLGSISNPALCRERAREDKKRERDEDEEDVYERRRLERRLRDKEAAYQEVCAPSQMQPAAPLQPRSSS